MTPRSYDLGAKFDLVFWRNYLPRLPQLQAEGFLRLPFPRCESWAVACRRLMDEAKYHYQVGQISVSKWANPEYRTHYVITMRPIAVSPKTP